MGTAQLVFAEVLWGATGNDVSHVTGSYVSHCPEVCSAHAQPSRAFSPKVKSVTWLEEALSGSRFCACPVFPRAFFLVVVTWLPMWPKVTWALSGFPWVCACATPVVVVVVVVNNVGWGCSLRRPRPIAIGNHRKPHVLYLAWWLINLIPTCKVSNKKLFQDDSSQFWKTMYRERRRRRRMVGKREGGGGGLFVCNYD